MEESIGYFKELSQNLPVICARFISRFNQSNNEIVTLRLGLFCVTESVNSCVAITIVSLETSVSIIKSDMMIFRDYENRFPKRWMSIPN